MTLNLCLNPPVCLTSYVKLCCTSLLAPPVEPHTCNLRSSTPNTCCFTDSFIFANYLPASSFFIMLAILPMFVSRSCLTKVLRSFLSRQMAPVCSLTSYISGHIPSSHALRAAHIRMPASKLLCTPNSLGSSALRSLDMSVTTIRTQTVSNSKNTPVGIIGNENLQVQLKGREVCIPLLWLRDHCRCQTCYNSVTFQKNTDNSSLQNSAVKRFGVQDDTLSVKWQDGHISKYSLQWLADNFYFGGVKAERFLWDGPRITKEALPTTNFAYHMKTEEGLKNTLRNIIKYGFCIVDGVPATAEATEKVTGRISFPLETVFGRVSIMVSGDLEHSDTAYTSVSLGAHNDTTYLTVPAGIQVFHCLQHDGEGGQTLLVDGFNAADKLQQRDPASFDCLIRTQIPHEYIENSQYHLYSVSTVLSTDTLSGQLTQIRFNPYDRAPLKTIHMEDIAQFYNSYSALTQIIRSKDSEFWIKLNPGMVLLVDNWRVMHGRSSFTGRRVLCGLYLPRDDWTSRARVLGLM